jgi:hypothetical protein
MSGFKFKNRYCMYGESVRVDVSTRSHPETYAIVDHDDALEMYQHRWAATKRGNALYVRGTVNGESILLHRFIMKPPAPMAVDHADGDPLNNRRSNLRVCMNCDNVRAGAERKQGTRMFDPRTRRATIEAWKAIENKEQTQSEM